MRRPNLFIVGQSKSGTSALYYFLKEHPDIFMSPDKEPGYFCKDLIEESDAFHGKRSFFRYRDEESYLSLFKGANGESFIGEASTLYIYSKLAAKEIYNFNPEAKIIIILREPVSFVYSLHNEHFRKAHEDVADFKKAVGLEKERRAGLHIPQNCHFPSELYYSERVKYAEQVRRFADRFGWDRVKVIIYEDFREDNERICLEILQFLGVDIGRGEKIEGKNISRMPRWGRLNTLIMSSSIKKGLERLLPHALYSKIKPIGRSILWGSKRPLPIDDSFRRELMREYKEEVVKIGEYLNRNLIRRWGYDTP